MPKESVLTSAIEQKQIIMWGGFCYEEKKYFQYAAYKIQYKTTQLPGDVTNSTIPGNDCIGAPQWQGECIFMMKVIAFDRGAIQGETVGFCAL